MTEPGTALRVLWLIKGLGPGGAERLLVEQAAAGGRDGITYEVAYLLSWKQHLVPELEALGVRTHCLGVRTERDLRWVARLAGLLRRERFDVVHAHSPLVAAPARLLVRARARAHRPAFVYTEHNRWPSYRPFTRYANRLTYPLDDAVFAVSADVRASVSPRCRDQVEVLVHGVDVPRVRAHLDERLAARAELGIGDGEVLAVTVANLREGKNYPGLLRAARLVVDRDLPVQFVTAGQGQLEAEIRTMLRASGLGDRFRMLGYRDDATRLIAAADLFVLASHHEGLPVTVMEALTLGVPVIAPAVGGLPEVVITGVNGILVEPESSAALADAIVEASDPARRAELSEGARRTGERFSSANAVARIEAEYRTLTRRAGPDAR
ncbi:MAG: glycosyltransferase [Acidimicrobiia bacterium]